MTVDATQTIHVCTVDAVLTTHVTVDAVLTIHVTADFVLTLST